MNHPCVPFGFTHQPISGKNNKCFYRSILFSTYKQNIEPGITYYRNNGDVSKFIQYIIKYISQTLARTQDSTEKFLLTEAITTLKNSNSQADSYIMTLISKMYNLCLHVYEENHTGDTVKCTWKRYLTVDSACGAGSNSVYLHYSLRSYTGNYNHYSVLQESTASPPKYSALQESTASLPKYAMQKNKTTTSADTLVITACGISAFGAALLAFLFVRK